VRRIVVGPARAMMTLTLVVAETSAKVLLERLPNPEPGSA